jgi:hypothetical protein
VHEIIPLWAAGGLIGCPFRMEGPDRRLRALRAQRVAMAERNDIRHVLMTPADYDCPTPVESIEWMSTERSFRCPSLVKVTGPAAAGAMLGATGGLGPG